MIYEVDFGIYKTFKGVWYNLERIKELGTTHVELMPVLKHNNSTVWGYETIDFHRLHPTYGDVGDFSELVYKCHSLGMKVIVDMCFNHCGDTEVFKEKDWFVTSECGEHTNYSGCGNTFNAHNPSFIEYCKGSMDMLLGLGVDGFRFDLAPLLMIDGKGALHYKGSLLEVIDTEYVDFIRIYEPWSVNDYMKSKFSLTGYEWNDKIRDAIRRYVLQGGHNIDELVAEMNAYEGNINYVACHDGFSLWDCLSYSEKNNYINGEGNVDGNPNELCGIVDESNRVELCKKALRLVILSKGIPMLRSGDELLATFYGNNNNYKVTKTESKTDISEWISLSTGLKKSVDYSKPITYDDKYIIFQGFGCEIKIDR